VLPIVLTLKKAPNFEGSTIQLRITAPDGSTVQYGVDLKPSVLVYQIPFKVPPAGTGGLWTVSDLVFNSGGDAKQVALPFKKYTFRVLPKEGLEFPASADIGVNPSQVQLLRTEAIHLQERIRGIKNAILAQRNESALIGQLKASLKEAIAALLDTETRFQLLATEPKQKEVAQIFFNDLRISYDGVVPELDLPRKAISSRAAVLIKVSSPSDEGSGHYPQVSQGVLRVFEQNEAAYMAVADARELTFNLDVSSIPPTATVYYKRRGDDFKKNPDVTDCSLRALPYAIWIIRIEEKGYKPEEVEHDPFREPNHVIKIALSK
jgi:hypothetical protein